MGDSLYWLLRANGCEGRVVAVLELFVRRLLFGEEFAELEELYCDVRANG